VVFGYGIQAANPGAPLPSPGFSTSGLLSFFRWRDDPRRALAITAAFRPAIRDWRYMVRIEPLLSGNFSEGVWQGTVIAKEKRLLGV
jgi:hypothetical protein